MLGVFLGAGAGAGVQFNLKYIAQKEHDGMWCQNAYVWRKSAGNR